MKNEELVLRKRAHSFVDRVKEIVIRSQPTLTAANMMIVRIRAVRDEVRVFFSDSIDKAKVSERAAKEARIAIVATKDEIDEPLFNAENAVKGKIKTYLLAEEKKREDAELKRLEKIREVREKAEAERAKGHHEEAEEMDETAEILIPSEYVKSAPRMTGIHARDKWRYRVIDPTKIPRRYLMIDTVKINQEVTLKKGATRIPGIEAYKDMIIAKTRG